MSKLSEWIKTQAEFAAIKNGCSSLEGFYDKVSLKAIEQVGKSFYNMQTSFQQFDRDFPENKKNEQAMLDYIEAVDAQRVALNPDKAISTESTVAYYLKKEIKNGPTLDANPPKAIVENVDIYELQKRYGVVKDVNGNYVVTLNQSQAQSLYNQEEKEKLQGVKPFMAEDAKKYEEKYEQNTNTLKSGFDRFFGNGKNAELLKTKEGRNQLCTDLYNDCKPLSQTEQNDNRRMGYCACVVDDYYRGEQNKENSFTNNLCENVSAKYTIKQIEKDPNSRVNGRMSEGYKEFSEKQKTKAEEKSTKLLKEGQATQDKKTIANASVTKDTAKTFNVGDTNVRNLEQEKDKSQRR